MRGFTVEMIVSVIVLNVTSREVLFKVFDVYSCRPYESKDLKPVNIEITMIKGRKYMYFMTEYSTW